MAYAACTILGLSGPLCTMLYEMIFPWVFTFAIIFGLLIKSGIFGDDKTARGVSGIIAVVLGFFLTAFTPWGSTVGMFFINASGITVMFLTAILGILLVLTLINPQLFKGGITTKMFIPALIVIFIAWLLLGGLTGGIGWYGSFAGQDLVALLIILAVIGAMMWFVTSSESGDKPKTPKGPNE